MARPMSRLMDAKRGLWLSVVVLGVASLLPARWLAWAGWFGTLVQTIAVPISHPVSRVVRAVTTTGLGASEDETARAWRLRSEEFEALYLRAIEENRALRELMEEMRAVVALSPDTSVRHLAAPVVAGASESSSGLLTVRVPVGQAVPAGTTVAVVEGVQVLGRVDSVRGWSCVVRPITDASAGRVEGVVLLGEGAGGPRLRCTLTPTGGGTLAGPVEDVDTAGVLPEDLVGRRVRLLDPTWPSGAQMLVLGQVERVEANPEQPLRRMLVVRPLVELSRVSDVVLRIPTGGDLGGQGPTGAGGRP